MPKQSRSASFGPGKAPFPWVRLNHEMYGIPLPAFAFDYRELKMVGRSPADLGMTRMKSDERFEIPYCPKGMGVDLRSRRDIDIVRYRPDSGSGRELILGGQFVDSHPDHWWNAVHAESRVIAFAADTAALADAIATRPNDPFDHEAWLADTWLAIMPLAVAMFPTGVGTRGPE